MSHKYDEIVDVMSFWIAGTTAVRANSAHRDRAIIIYEFDKDNKIVGVELLGFRARFLEEWRHKWGRSEERAKLPKWLQLETDRVLLQTMNWSAIH